MKIPVVSGRDFRPADTSPGVAIVNETFAKTYFQGQDPIGRTFQRGAHRPLNKIVGVTAMFLTMTCASPIARSSTFLSPESTANQPPLRKASPPSWFTSMRRTRSLLPTPFASSLPSATTGFASQTSHAARSGSRPDHSRATDRHPCRLFCGRCAAARRHRALRCAELLRAPAPPRDWDSHGDWVIARGHCASCDFRCFRDDRAGRLRGRRTRPGAARSVSSLFYQVKATDAEMLALPVCAILVTALVATLPAVLRALRTDPTEILRAE